MFVVFMFFSAWPHLHTHLHSPWFYVTAGMKIHDHLWYKLAQGSHVFPVKKINLACGAYALMFALRWVAIFIPIFTTDSFTKWPQLSNVGDQHAKAQLTFYMKFLQDFVFQVPLYLIMEHNLQLKNLESSTKNFQLFMWQQLHSIQDPAAKWNASLIRLSKH